MRGQQRDSGLTSAFLRETRPRQWPKNLLVLAAPAAAGQLGHRDVLLRALAATAIFCVASIGTYFFNDAFDVASDRAHSRKRTRPVAAGEISTGTATITGGLLMAGSVLAAFALAGQPLAIVMAAYVLVNVAYTTWLRRVAVIDLACISAGFVLRAIAGGAATGVPLSTWFLVVACFGSLLVAAGKRTAEADELGDAAPSTRTTLGAYPPGFLHFVRLLASTVLVTSYCLWAFDYSGRDHDNPHEMIWYELSIVPVVLVVLYLELAFESGRGAAPEDLALSDRVLQVLGLTWLGLLAVGIYVT